MRLPLWPALLVALAASPARAQLPADGIVAIGRVDSVWSPALGERRRYLVYTPRSYGDTTYLPQRYPVLYLLDGDSHFHSVTGLLHVLGSGVNGTFAIPEMIVVAIPNTDRTRDMTPTRVERGLDGKPSPWAKTSGGMANFLRFLAEELAPHIDSAYRTAPYRVLVGHSFGGITALNALYTRPTAFNAYVSIDPSLWWDDRLLLRQAKEHLSRPAVFAGRALFVAQANTISPADTAVNVHFGAIAQFNGVAKAHRESGLRYGFRYYDEEDHGSVPLLAEYDALRFVFDGYKVPLLQVLDRPEYLREHFGRLSAQLGYTILPPEPMVDMVGRFLIQSDTTKAITLRTMYTELYPQSAHAHETLGAVWAARGDTARASAAYQRALALNPRHTRALEGMKKLRGR